MFPDYLNHKIATLSKEVGKSFRCYYDSNGLPNNVLYQMKSGLGARGEEASEVKMLLIESSTGNELDSYLTNVLGLQKGEDFERHANGQRGGVMFFDILTDHAVAALLERAEQVGNAPTGERVQAIRDRHDSPER